MVDTLIAVAVGIVVYTVLAMALKARGYLPEYVDVSGPILTIRTQRGKKFLDRLARYERFWRAWGNIGVGIALVVMVLAGLIVAFSVYAIINQPDGAAIENPQNVLVIPGVNDFLPLSAAPEIVFGLLVGLVVHEGGHGLFCRVEDIEIDSMGVALISLVPLGAFVEPDAKDQRRADRGAQSRMFAAGITNNFAVTILALAGIVALASTISVVAGAPIGDTFAGSGADQAGIEQGDIITEIDGTPVENSSHFETVLANTTEERVTVARNDGSDVTVQREILITGAVSELVPNITLGGDQQPRIQSVNGTTVSTEQEFVAVVENRSVATIQTTHGDETLPIGAYVFDVDGDGPLADAGAPANEELILTAVDGTRITNTSAFESTLDTVEPGQDVTVEAYLDDGTGRFTNTTDQFNVTVGGSQSDPKLGVTVVDGYSGLLLNDFGVDPYPAEQFLAMLGGNAIPDDFSAISSFLWYQLQLLVLPFATLLVDQFSYNFAGFTGGVGDFFVVDGPLSVFGGGVLYALNLLFWTWWINFNLALFNCIPSFPLDGGHIFRTATESIGARLPTSYNREIVTVVTISMTLVMVVALLLLVFGPLILS
jgi:membrane-associated protease RseP (regulator of RpoE activity)